MPPWMKIRRWDHPSPAIIHTDTGGAYSTRCAVDVEKLYGLRCAPKMWNTTGYACIWKLEMVKED
eukprot:10084711-Prorocentrum_lima.AAC.1